MPGWQGSNRRQELPPDWAKIRQRVFRRDGGRCTWVDDNVRCPEPATDVDHIRRGNDHSLENLRSLCGWHHQRRTSGDGARAQHAAVRRNKSRYRRAEQHPRLG